MNIVSVKKEIKIPIFMGKEDNWEDIVKDLTAIRNLLIIGAPGCGKSTLIHNIICNIIYHTSCNNVRILLIDSNFVEFNIYNNIPHLLTPVIKDERKIEGALEWLTSEIKTRMNALDSINARSINEYNEKSETALPYLILVYDGYSPEFFDCNNYLTEILRFGSRVGVYFIVSCCSINRMRGLANKFNAFSCFKTLVDQKLPHIKHSYVKHLGIGEFKYIDFYQDESIQLKSPKIDFEKYGSFLQNQKIYNNAEADKIPHKIYNNSNDIFSESIDAYFEEAGKLIIDKDKASIGILQRMFRIGFNRAARIMDQLCDAGVVGPEEGAKPRKVLMTMEEFEKYVNHLKNEEESL